MISIASQFNPVLFPDTHDHLIIASDDEPDDAVAKFMLLSAARQHGLKVLVITGEGRTPKLELICHQAAALGVQCMMVQGQLSQREYPLEMLTAFDGLTPQQRLAASTDGGATPDPTEATRALREVLEKSQNPLYVMLKPCWELFDMPKELLAKLTVAAYGSFNFRCLFEKHDRTKLAQFFNASFKRVVLYETFFVMGEDNSINSVNAPRFYELIRQKAAAGDRYWIGVRDSIAIWNNHIVQSQLKSVNEVSKAMRDSWEEESHQIVTAADESDKVWKKRKANVDKILQGGAKIVNSIIVAKGQQMVFADFGLAALMLAENKALVPADSVVCCNIKFDEGRGNTIVEPSAEGKVFVLKNINRAALVAACEKAIE